MRWIQEVNLSTRVLILCTIAGTFMLGSQAVSWGTTDCRVPNPSTKYCTEAPPDMVDDCATLNGEPDECNRSFLLQRNQFPDGSVTSRRGAVEQVRAECSKKTKCRYQTDGNRCVAGTQQRHWKKADKTDRQLGERCPTTES